MVGCCYYCGASAGAGRGPGRSCCLVAGFIYKNLCTPSFGVVVGAAVCVSVVFYQAYHIIYKSTVYTIARARFLSFFHSLPISLVFS